MSGSVREIETAADLEAAIAASDRHRPSMRGWQVQDLDVHRFEERLTAFDPRGSLFLGAGVSDAFAERLRAGGALVFPRLPDLPFDPWRSALYTPGELYADLAEGYPATPDARIYAWSRFADDGDLLRLLAVALHDSSVDDALADYVHGRRVVGVMGGHELHRDDPAYAEAARLGHDLAATGLTVATGGGPGAMEAANLGARLAGEPTTTLERAVEAVARVPSFQPDVTAWATSALGAVSGLADSGCSLGIPTWHYGHEPPNAFASAVAKYFRNAIREDVLLQVCGAGLVFLPGAAGTVQEVFQAACTHFYAEADLVTPMVFVGERHWTEELPVWPLVRRLGAGRPLAGKLQLVDDAADVVAALVQE